MRRVTTRRELVELNQAEFEARGHDGPLQVCIAGAVGPPAGLILWVKYALGRDLVECHREAINLWAGNYTVGTGNALFLARHLLVDPEAFRLQLEPSTDPLPHGAVAFGTEPQYCAERMQPFWGGATGQEQASLVNAWGDPDKATSQVAALMSRVLAELGLVLPKTSDSLDAVGEADCVTLDDWRAAGAAKPHTWLAGLWSVDPEAALCITTLDAAAQAEATERSLQTWCTGKRIVNEGSLACQLASRVCVTGPNGGQFVTVEDAKHMPAGAVKACALASYFLDDRHAQQEKYTFRSGLPAAAVGSSGGVGPTDVLGGGEAPPSAE